MSREYWITHQQQIIQGTLPDTTKLFSLLPRTDTIISLLGPIGLRNHNTEVSDLYSALLAHLKTSTTPTHPAPHILALTTISFKRPSDSFPFVARLMVNLVWLFVNGAYTEVLRIGDVFEKEGAGLPWTNYRVAYLGAEEGEGLEEARTGSVGVGGWNLRTERKELALWLVGEAERGPEGSQWIGKFPAIFGGKGKGE